MTETQSSINELKLINTQLRMQNEILTKQVEEAKRLAAAIHQLSSALAARG